MTSVGCTVPWMYGDGALEVCNSEEQAKQAATLYFDTLLSGIDVK